MIYSTRELMFGLDISATTIGKWRENEGMPVVKDKPYIFDRTALEWIVRNKPDFAERAKKMLEVEDV
jgi:hypothetical protein